MNGQPKRRRPRGQGSLYKRVSDGPWIAAWRAHDGKRCEKSTNTTDKAVAQRILAKNVGDAALRKSGVIDARSDGFMQAERRPLSEHVADWQQGLLDRGGTVQHATLSRNRVQAVFDGTGATALSDLNGDRVLHYLAERRAAGLSLESANHYLRACKGFGHWLVRSGRARENPLAHLPLFNTATDRRHDRRALDDTELRLLLETTRNAPTRWGMSGAARGLLYWTAATTGLRAAELRSLTWAAFNLDGPEPTVTLAACYSKRRRTDVQPLVADLATALTRWRNETGGADSDPVFTMPVKGNVAQMLRDDLADAGIPYRDDAGRYADFHSLRHTFISNLARGGVYPKLAQQLARHSTITLTLDRYTHTVAGDLAHALAALPSLAPVGTESERLAATGTYDDKADVRGLFSTLIPTLTCRDMPQRAASCDSNGDKVSSPGHTEKTIENKAKGDVRRRAATVDSVKAAKGFGPLNDGFEVRFRHSSSASHHLWRSAAAEDRVGVFSVLVSCHPSWAAP